MPLARDKTAPRNTGTYNPLLNPVSRDADAEQGLASEDSEVAAKASAIHPTRASSEALEHTAADHDVNRIEVRVRIDVKRVVVVDVVAQTFTVTLQLEASWIDRQMGEIEGDEIKTSTNSAQERQREQRAGILKVVGSENDFFAPRLSFKNCIEETDSDCWFQIYRDGADPTKPPVVCFRWKMTGVFQEEMHLRLFPIDSQGLKIQLLTGWATKSVDALPAEQNWTVRLVRNQSGLYKSFCNVSASKITTEYTLSDKIKFTESRTDKKDSAQRHEYSMLDMELNIQRKPGFWIHQVVVPMLLITTAILTSFFVPQRNLTDRCSITLTLLLAMVGIKYVIGQHLPRLSYATLIDYYVLCCFTAAFLVILEQSLASAGLWTEPQMVWRVAHNITGGSNRSEVAAVGGAAAAGGTTLPVLGLFGAVVWMVLHGIATLALWLKRRHLHSKNSFFTHADAVQNRSVWLGPISETAKERDVVAYMKEMTTTADDAECDANERVELGEPRVVVWTPETAKESLENNGFPSRRFGEKPFAVVVFDNHEQAEQALVSFEMNRHRRTGRTYITSGKTHPISTGQESRPRERSAICFSGHNGTQEETCDARTQGGLAGTAIRLNLYIRERRKSYTIIS